MGVGSYGLEGTASAADSMGGTLATGNFDGARGDVVVCAEEDDVRFVQKALGRAI